MQKKWLTSITFLVCLAANSVNAQNLPDLQVESLDITPVPEGMTAPRLQIFLNKSYRFQITIRNVGKAAAGSCFVVRTKCVRPGMDVTLGEAVVGQASSPLMYAVYDVLPVRAKLGDCVMRTFVDADQSVEESDETPLSNIWDRDVTILP